MIIFGKKWGVLVKSGVVLVKSRGILVVGAFWPVALLFGVKYHHFNISDTSWRLKKPKKIQTNTFNPFVALMKIAASCQRSPWLPLLVNMFSSSPALLLVLTFNVPMLEPYI